MTRFENWAASGELVLTADEREFLEASIGLREQRVAAEIERQEQEARLERRASQRLRALGAVGALALVVIVGLVVAAVLLAQEQSLSEERERLVKALELTSAARENLELDPELSVLLALEAAENSYVSDGYMLPELEELLHRAVQADGVERSIDMGGTAEFSPDGTMLAVGDADGLLRMWDPDTGEDVWDILRYQGGSQRINDIVFSTDGRFLATSSSDGLVKIWEASSGRELAFIDRSEGVIDVAFSPAEQLLVTVDNDGALRSWNLEPVIAAPSNSESPVELLESTLLWQEKVSISDVAFSPDGTMIAFLIPDRGTVAIDTLTNRQILEINETGGVAGEIAFYYNGDYLAASSGDREASIWDTESGAKILTVSDMSSVTDLGFSPDGRYLATATVEGSVSIWDLTTGRKARRLAGHANRIEDIAFNRITGKLATSGADRVTRIWDLNQAASELFSIAAHQGEAYDAVFSADGTKITSAGQDGKVKVWDAATGQLLHTFPSRLEGRHYPAFSPDGERLAAVGRDGGINIWDANSGNKLLTLDSETPNYITLSFSPDGQQLAAAGDEDVVRIWDVDSGKMVNALYAESQFVSELFFTPDGSNIRTFIAGGLVTTWAASSGVPLDYFPVSCQLDTQIDAEVSADGLVTAVACGRIILIRKDELLESEGTRYALEDDIVGASGVAFDPEGSFLAVSSSAGVIKLMDVDAEEELFTLAGEELLSKGEEIGRDTRGGIPFYHPFGFINPDESSLGVAFTGIDISPDGRFLVGTAADGTLRVYVIAINELMEAARSRLSRGFTDVECRKYLALDSCPEKS